MSYFEDSRRTLLTGAIASLLVVVLQLYIITEPNPSSYGLFLQIPNIVFEFFKSYVSPFGSKVSLILYLIYSSSPALLLSIAYRRGILKQVFVFSILPVAILLIYLVVFYITSLSKIESQGGLGLAIGFLVISTMPIALLPLSITLYLIINHFSLQKKIFDKLKSIL